MSNFTTENKDGFSIVYMKSQQLDNQATAELRSNLVILAGSGVKNIIIDLEPCHYCDTSGLGAIMIAHRLCKEGALVLSGVSEEVEKMLSIQRFEPELVIEPSLASAEAHMKEIVSAQSR